MTTQHKPLRSQATAIERGQLRISVEGDAATVARLLAGMAAQLGEATSAISEPEPLFLSRAQAAARSGYTENRLSNLVKVGRLTNHGTPARMLFSLAEIRALAD